MIRTSIYKLLASDPILVSLLSKADGLEEGPAIYEYPVHPDATMPYLVLTYSESPATDHVIKRAGRISIDIVNDTTDSTVQESILNAIRDLLDLCHFYDPDEGPVKLYLDSMGEFVTDTDYIMHWNIAFTYNSWRKSFIEKLNNRT